MPKVFPDVALDLKFKKLTDALLYLPFDGDAEDDAQGASPSTETGGIIYPQHVTAQIGGAGGAVQLAEATTNLITNPSFETNTTGWDNGGGANNLIAQSADQAKMGSNSLKCTFKTGGTEALARYAITLTAAAHSASLRVYIPTAFDAGGIAATFIAFGGATGITIATADMAKRDQWQVLTWVGTPDAGDLAGIVYFYHTGADPSDGKFVYIDGAQVEAKAYPTPYCDGSLGTDHSWSGAAHASTSSRTAVDLDYSITLQSEGTIAAWLQIQDWDNTRTAPRIFASTNSHHQLWWNGTDRFLHRVGAGSNSTSSPATVTDATFGLVILTWDDSATKLYWNGIEIDSATPGATFTDAILQIGNRPALDRDLSGFLDEFIVLDYALSASEVQTLYEDGLDAIAFNGVWTDVISDVRAADMIKVSYGIKGFLPTQRTAGAGSMKFALDNGEGNSAGLLGYYAPGHANVRTGFDVGIGCRLKLTHNSIRYYKFNGTVREIKVVPGKYGVRKTRIKAVDWMQDASQHKVDLIGFATDQRSDQVVQDILDNMTKQPPQSNLEQGQSTFAFALDGLKDEKTTALAAIQRAVLSEFGYAYVVGDQAGGGKFVFEDRHTRVTSTAVDADLTESEIVQMEVERSDKNIFNVVRATSHPRDVGITNGVLWNLPSSIQINANASVTILARFRDPDQTSARLSGKDMVTPAADTDYKFGSSEGGGSNDKNGDLSITPTFGANSAKLVLQNTSLTAGYLNLMQLRGKAVRIFDPAVALAVDSTSQTDYGDRPLDLSLLYQDDPLEAQDFADITLSVWKDPQNLIKKVAFWANRNTTLLTDALEVEPGSRVEFSESVAAFSDVEHFVNGVELEIRPKDILKCIWFVTLASTQQYWLLGSVGFSELGQTTTLGF